MGRANRIELFSVLSVVIFFTSITLTLANNNRPLIRNTDRSVYARRSFALPDVVSDVYEVYVGPSVIQVNFYFIIGN